MESHEAIIKIAEEITGDELVGKAWDIVSNVRFNKYNQPILFGNVVLVDSSGKKSKHYEFVHTAKGWKRCCMYCDEAVFEEKDLVISKGGWCYHKYCDSIKRDKSHSLKTLSSGQSKAQETTVK